MLKIKRVLLSLSILIFILPLAAKAQSSLTFPKPTEYGYVNDYANILSNETEQNIFLMGQELDNKTNAQIVVVTMDKLPADITIEEYANELFRAWGIGDAKLNNGLLILVNMDPEDRAIRTEVGDGLEGRIPDAISHRITDEIIIPYFMEGDYDNGLLKGYYEICSRVAEEYGVSLSRDYEVEERNVPSPRTSNLPAIIAIILFFAFDGLFLKFRIIRLIFYILASSRFRGGGGGFGGGGRSGGGFGGFGGGRSSGGGSTGRW
ncbi:hypothetical protein OXPF_14890 [Oxobacter pfennigii]|uniref:TPM domain-containing protein n=1 Tax=Oxobacter pfennigii TaxID=36849 RepID=A0A0P8YYY1_9CLOT|nr:TPM domain-containing protein [Oxobacter pfennigii]KPU45011.1 hypothetical protein OXPF_14890 [Oxobacter pfennigii]